MENKVRYDDAMAADDIGVSVWALRCNVRAHEHICTLSDASMFPRNPAAATCCCYMPPSSTDSHVLWFKRDYKRSVSVDDRVYLGFSESYRRCQTLNLFFFFFSLRRCERSPALVHLQRFRSEFNRSTFLFISVQIQTNTTVSPLMERLDSIRDHITPTASSHDGNCQRLSHLSHLYRTQFTPYWL